MALIGSAGPAATDVAKVANISQREHVDDEDGEETEAGHQSINHSSLLAFYTSHGLFMANNRAYEFASVLFTAAAFPHTLVAASLRGLSAHLSSVLVSPSIGKWCDTQHSRLRPVQICIVVQRFCIASACLGWALIVQENDAHHQTSASQDQQNKQLKKITFAVLLVLGMLERLSAVGNVIVVERDWLPLLARCTRSADVTRNASISKSHIAQQEGTPLLSQDPPHQLHNLNATAKLIDLVTKLVTPLAVGAVAIGLPSVRSVAAVLAAIQLCSCALELYLTRLVWRTCPALQEPKAHADLVLEEHSGLSQQPCVCSYSERARAAFKGWLHCIKAYAQSSAFLPSLAFAIEPFSVLTLAGSMTAYLLVANFSLTHITAARTASTIVEISSTILTPLIIAWHSRSRGSSRSRIGGACVDSLIMVGLLGLFWQVVLLIPATVVLVIIGSSSTDLWSVSKLTAILFSSLALSRLGPFAYSLVEQQIVQMAVPAHERMRFSGVEMSLVDAAELARWGLLGVFGAPRQFRWVALISFASVASSLGLFGAWARSKRHATTAS